MKQKQADCVEVAATKKSFWPSPEWSSARLRCPVETVRLDWLLRQLLLRLLVTAVEGGRRFDYSLS